MKICWAFVFASILPFPTFAEDVDWKAVKDSVAPGIVRIHVVHEEQEWSEPYRHGKLARRQGTGFFINRTQMVTNQHIVEGAREIKIEGVATKEKFSVQLAAEPNLEFDLALLEFKYPAERVRFESFNGRIRPLTGAGQAAAQPGARVAVLGFGSSAQLVATQGIISSWEPNYDLYQRRLDRVTLIRTDAAVNPGNSGGPCVSPGGEVVGISSRFGEGENIGLLIPFMTAKKITDVMQSRGRFVKTAAGLVTYSLNPVLRRSLGLSSDRNGVVVSFVVPGSPAERAGLRQWDVLTAVDGHPIQHGEIRLEHIGKVPFWFVFNAASPGWKAEFEFLRDGKPATATLTMAAVEMPRIWMQMEADDYETEWGYLGGFVIVEVTRGLLQEIEDGDNWRWDLVNDNPRESKIYLVAEIEPDTQAMSYQDYGLDLFQLRILGIEGRPLQGDLTERLEDIYRRVEENRVPPVISVEFEKHFTIQLETSHLAAEKKAFKLRYPELGSGKNN